MVQASSPPQHTQTHSHTAKSKTRMHTVHTHTVEFGLFVGANRTHVLAHVQMADHTQLES